MMVFGSLIRHFRFIETLLQTFIITFETVDFPKLNTLAIFLILTSSFFTTGTTLIDKALQKIFLTLENSQSIPGLLQSHLKHYPTINILVLVLLNISPSFFRFF